MALQLKQKSTAEKKQREAKKAKFVAVGGPFQFRVVPADKFEDIEGVLEKGRLVFKIDQITEVDEFRYTEDVQVRKDDGTLAVEKRERVVDAVARCREYCASGRLAEVSDDTELPIPTPDDTEGDETKSTRKGRK